MHCKHGCRPGRRVKSKAPLHLAFFIKDVNNLFKNKILLIMGRGDIKTKKGKTFAGSFGKARPAKPAKKNVAPKKKA